MQVFEFYFNPKLKSDLIFDSFCYEPENIYERKMGGLYLVGLLKNVLPKNLQLLEKIAKLIKGEYYKKTIFTPEKSLKESLKEANNFLEQIAKRGDVSWLGNLSFAILTFTPHHGFWWGVKLNFTKVGGIKIFLLRTGKIIDIDKKLRFQDIEPYPLKIFGNIVSGKLAEGDLILVLTKEISDFFQENLLLNEIAKLPPHHNFGGGLKDILNGKKEELSKISGVCLAISLTKEVGYPAKGWVGRREIILPKISKEFSLKEVFSPFLRFLKFPKIRIPKLDIGALGVKIKPRIFNKKLILVLALIIILLLGFIFSRLEERQKIKIFEKNLEEVKEKLNLAYGLLILENPQAKKEANSLLKEGLEKITSILKETQNLPKELKGQVFSQRDEILEKLYGLNKLERIEGPELFFEFTPHQGPGGGFIPQKILTLGDDLYFFSPYSKDLFKLDKDKKETLLSIDKKFNLAETFDDSILFFSKPSQIFLLKFGEEKLNQLTILEEPYSDFNFDDFSSFKGNLYFFDKKAGQIIKYPYLGNFQWRRHPPTTLPSFAWAPPEFWLKKSVVGKGISVDGSVWVLAPHQKDGGGAISKYYAGNLQEKIEPNIFPPPKDFSKIFTSPTLPYLYLLEPIQKRIVILSKTGEIVKQFQSEKFDNLLDFAVSKDGKTIWLLNGLRVYQIKL